MSELEQGRAEERGESFRSLRGGNTVWRTGEKREKMRELEEAASVKKEHMQRKASS